ncbi:GntR family transcriptional regulator [Herbidospora mongoliensis]|uniref:GntR family transcriptional regulator n=1 Tax=Herbidospora mongoliensis TaxID=688067 RepID=UPI000A783C0F|nr:GntR family transcriptional regulator [Herbidospora mongoliensis]
MREQTTGPHLLRSSTAELVAGVLRDRIAQGVYEPGERLSEEAIGAELEISRNTLREAFRLLGHERLLVHKLNRGVFVRVLSASDVRDLYLVRRVIECAAVRNSAGGDVTACREAVDDAERAAAEDRWRDVGTANLRFHQALVALHGSSRLDELMGQLLAELRLVFHVMENPRAFHEPFVARNRALVGLLKAGRLPEAETFLSDYLDDAEALLQKAFSSGSPSRPGEGRL